MGSLGEDRCGFDHLEYASTPCPGDDKDLRDERKGKEEPIRPQSTGNRQSQRLSVLTCCLNRNLDSVRNV